MKKKNSNKTSNKSLFQIIGSSFIIIIGLFVIIAIGNSITGNVIGGSKSINPADIGAVFWGLLTIAAGVWIIGRKDFHKSIFKN